MSNYLDFFLIGATGPDGEKGDKGPRGDNAADGLAGPQGSDGPQGSKGHDAEGILPSYGGYITQGQQANVGNSPIEIRFNTDGTTEFRADNGAWSLAPVRNWWSTSPETNIGDNYEITRVNIGDQQEGYTASTITLSPSWISLSASRIFQMFRNINAAGTAGVSVEIHIRNIATPANIQISTFYLRATGP